MPDQLVDTLKKVKAQMTNPEEKIEMATKKAPKKTKPETNGHDEANEAPAAKPAKKKVAAKAATKSDDGLITLKELCAELKMEPTLARRYLRADKVPNPGRWAWPAGSKDLAKAREALTRE